MDFIEELSSVFYHKDTKAQRFLNISLCLRVFMI